MKKWFESNKFDKMKIIKYKSAANKAVVCEAVVTDVQYINSFKSLILQLPIEGDMMIKMGPDASFTSIEFYNEDKVECIQFYNSKIKTPQTSFFSQENTIETNIWSEVQLHLNAPVIGRPFLKIMGKDLVFPQFTIKYTKAEDRTPIGTSASLFVETYELTSKVNLSPQLIEVRSGQLPPRDVNFQVGNKNYSLISFSNDKIQLEPRQIIIVKK